MATSTSENLQNVAQSAKDTLAQQKDGAASSLGSFAGTLRKAARESGDGGENSAAHMAEWAADGLEQISATLRSMLHSRIDYPKDDDRSSISRRSAAPDRTTSRANRVVPRPGDS